MNLNQKSGFVNNHIFDEDKNHLLTITMNLSGYMKSKALKFM